MAEYQPDVRRVGSLASHLWNWSYARIWCMGVE